MQTKGAKRMLNDYIKDTPLPSKGAGKENQEKVALFDTDLFYTDDTQYKNLVVPLSPGVKTIVLDKRIVHPDSKEKVNISGNFKANVWIGNLLMEPIVVETVTYPERAKYPGTENYINKNLYRVSIPKNVYITKNKKTEVKSLISDGVKFPLELPERFDFIKKSKEGDLKPYNNLSPKTEYHYIFPIVLLEDNKPKIVFISQVINDKLKKSLEELKLGEPTTTAFVGEYLFATILASKPGDPVVFFKHPKLEYKTKEYAWSGWNWFSIYDKMEDLYKKQYFDFDFESIRSQVSEDYLALLAARYMSGNMADKKGNGKVFNEDKSVDVEKSSINSLVQHNIMSLLYKKLKDLKPSETPIAENNGDTEVSDTEEIPF